MIIGSYPCCGAPFLMEVPDKTPVYYPENCPSCGEKVWHRLSRFDPQSWTEKDFLKSHEVNKKTKEITAILIEDVDADFSHLPT